MKTRENFNKILFIRTDRFGDFLLNLPAIHALRQTFSSAAIYVMAHPFVAQLIVNHPDIDNVIECDEKIDLKGIIRKLRFIKKIRKERFDTAIISNPSKMLNSLIFFSRIPERVGYDRKWSFLLTKKIEDKKYLGSKHEIEYNLDLVGLIGAHTNSKEILLPVDAKEEKNVKEYLLGLGIDFNSGFVAVHPWTSDTTKKWPMDRFIKVAEELSRISDKKIAIIGGNEEIKDALKFCQSANSNIINLCGKLDLRHLPALLKNCLLLISNDSGPVHIASAVNTPTIVIFGKKNRAGSPTRWGPWGKNHIILQKDDLEAITVDEVFEAAKNILKINEKDSFN